MGKISSGQKFLRFQTPSMGEPKTRKKRKKNLSNSFIFKKNQPQPPLLHPTFTYVFAEF